MTQRITIVQLFEQMQERLSLRWLAGSQTGERVLPLAGLLCFTVYAQALSYRFTWQQ